MNNNITVSYSDLVKNGQQLRAYADDVKQTLNLVSNQIENMKSKWQSTAATQVYSKYENLSAKFPGYYQKIIEFASFLEQVQKVYEKTDEEIGNQSSGLIS